MLYVYNYYVIIKYKYNSTVCINIERFLTAKYVKIYFYYCRMYNVMDNKMLHL